MAAKSFRFLAAPALLALLFAGCTEHLGRRDGATSFAGDAKAANAAIMTIDPWPRHAENTQIGMDGIKAQRAMERYYRAGDTPTPQPLQLTLTPPPAAAPPASKTD